MAGTMVSASAGAMNSLLCKLTILMGEEYNKLKGSRKEVASLEDEFRSMNALLEKLANMDDLDAPAKEWRNQVRDMSYEIEDCIDDFMHYFGKNDATIGFLKKIVRFLKNLRARHQTGSKIREIKAQVLEASDRRMRYRLDEYIHNPDISPVDPRVVAIYKEAASLVGIDTPREELVKLLMDNEPELKVASIVGFGGLGKTTLANQVYQKLEGQFKCRSFVSASQKPDITKLLNKILLDIRGDLCQSSEMDELLRNIREHLRDKRYFIIIDDLWDSSAWEVIKCAFPENSHGSRVLTTTRIHSVAFGCCSYSKKYVYNMRPLDEDDSRRLLFSRIFGFGEACPDAFENLSVDILKRCGGLPLAIISIASLLAGQPKVTWEYVHNSLCSMFEANPNLEDMKRILDLSYRNLPHHLKTCLLYLGMYPEDYTIMKNDLVRQWIAEGFVSSIHGLDAEDIAGSYFNELINKNMIQPVFTDYNDEVISCKVHDLMLDLIRVKSGEDNFLDVIDDLEDLTKMHKKTRRVSLHYACEGYSVTPTKIKGSLGQIRSVVAFTKAFLPSYHGFKYIRVLSLHFWTGVSTGTSFRIHNIDLTSICGLYLLEYLKIVSNTGLELPNQLWSLRYLETMDLQPLGNLSIPSDIIRLGRLLHLTVPSGTAFQDAIGNLKSLRTLHGFDFSRSSLGSIESLGELTNLRDLELSCKDCGNVGDFVMDALRFSLEKLSHPSNLKSLVFSLALIPNSHLDWFNTLSSFPHHLQRLHPQGFWFSRIPKWIAQLRDLYSLQLVVRKIVPKDDDIGILAGLPCLARLYLNFVEVPEERIVIPGAGVAFPALKQLELKCPKLFPAFDVGAMPRLQKLELSFSMVRWEDLIKWLQPNGIDNLPPSLKKVLLRCYGQLTGEDTRSEVRSVFSAHHPDIDLIFSGFL